MIKLQPIFSDNALFLHSALLTLRGTADSSSVSAKLTLGDKAITEASSTVNENGVFELTFTTPAASFDEYELQHYGDIRALRELRCIQVHTR